MVSEQGLVSSWKEKETCNHGWYSGSDGIEDEDAAPSSSSYVSTLDHSITQATDRLRDDETYRDSDEAPQPVQRGGLLRFDRREPLVDPWKFGSEQRGGVGQVSDARDTFRIHVFDMGSDIPAADGGGHFTGFAHR